MSSSKKLIPMQKLIPSVITITSLCLGITSIKYSFETNYNIAVGLIILAAFLDGIDGRVARYLNTTSKFGAQLDSLSDMCSFGVSPAVMIYLWSLHYTSFRGIVGWALILFYITCSALRLARFNITALDSEDIKESDNVNCFFQGMPMPAAAILLLTPIMLTFSFVSSDFFNDLSFFIGGYLLTISILMVSKVPIYSGKNINIDKDKVNYLLVFIGVLTTSVILEPWILIPLISLSYVVVVIANICLLLKKKNIDK